MNGVVVFAEPYHDRHDDGGQTPAGLRARHRIRCHRRAALPRPAKAKCLGHDPAITLRVYGHVYDALASAGDALLGRSRASNAE
jgi:hypothetical protein